MERIFISSSTSSAYASTRTPAGYLPALATYLPTSPSTAKSRTQRRRGGRGGSPVSRRVLFLLRTCADVRFSVQIPPKPAGDLKILRARAREPPTPRCAHDRKTPQVPQTAAFCCRWPQNRGVPKNFGNILTAAGLPTYLAYVPWTFFCMPLVSAAVSLLVTESPDRPPPLGRRL